MHSGRLAWILAALITVSCGQASSDSTDKAGGPGSKPHIVTVLQDDLGWYDTGIHNPEAASWTQNITALSKQGIVLMNHYVHWHCSPTRRSFLSGRLPIHHGEQLSRDDTDDIDLRMSWVSDKLHRAGYLSHWFGKMHTGFQSMRHLGVAHGFNSTIGSFETGGAYSGPAHTMRWENDHPIYTDAQFTNKPGADSRRGGAVCGAGGGPDDAAFASGAQKVLPGCNATIFPDSNLQYGHALQFIAASSPALCCGSCAALSGCTHWVLHPWQGETGCHLKTGYGSTAHRTAMNGSTAGIMTGAKPGGGGSVDKCVGEYSTDLWGALALQAVEQHPTSAEIPLYLHLCFEAVHTPYDKAPGDPTGSVYRGLVWRADVYIGALVSLLKARSMWDNLLFYYSADNGGVGDGVNYPLRGEKHSNWEGGLRAVAFVTGGMIPSTLRGSTNSINFHIVDLHATISFLVGQPVGDDPPVPPKKADQRNPYNNIYGENSFPPLDGVNIWPMLMKPGDYKIDAAHPTLVLSKEVVVAANYKLLVSQPFFKTQNNGWKDQNGTWSQDNGGLSTMDCTFQDLSPQQSFFPVPHNSSLRPCLFDLRKDPSERHDLSSQLPAVVQQLWAALNATILTSRDCSGWAYEGTGHQIPGPVQEGEEQGNTSTACSPPQLKGPCDATCSSAYWETKWPKLDGLGGSSGTPPRCGVPGCV